MASAAPIFKGKTGRSLRFPEQLGTDEVPNYVTFRPTAVKYGRTEGELVTQKNYGKAMIKPDLTPYVYGGNSATVGGPAAAITFNNPFAEIASRIGGWFDSIANSANINVDTGYGDVGINLGGDGINNIISGRLNLGPLSLDIGGSGALKSKPTTIHKNPGINLYLPPSLRSAVEANYNEQSLGGAGMQAIDFVSNSPDAAMTMNTAGNLAGAVASELLSGRVAGAAQVATGRAKNQYTFAIFNGMKHRNFSYDFRLIAKNKQESEMIKKICDGFMFYMLPLKAEGDFHFYDTPCMWEISYNRLGSKIPFLDQPRECFLKNVDVSYGADAFGQLYNNGAPMTVNLKLSFMEILPLQREDGAREGVESPFIKGISDSINGIFESKGGGGK